MLNKKKRSIFFLLAVVIIGIGQNAICFAQDESKGILPDEYVKRNRPVRNIPLKPSNNIGNKKETRPTPQTKLTISKATTAKKRFYRIVKSQPSEFAISTRAKLDPTNTEEASLGLTVWRCPAAKDTNAKDLTEEESVGSMPQAENKCVRNESEAPLAVNDRIHLSVEALSSSGYLYVIDRELYSDGTYSPPKLVYPTLKTRRRNDIIGAGNLIFIPESGNFVVTSKQIEKKQVAEVLTFIVSPRVLIKESMLKDKAIYLPVSLFNDWLKHWEVETTILDQIDGAGQAMTPIEKAARGDLSKDLTEELTVLTQDDALPQSTYRVKIKRGNPLLVNIFLKFRPN